MWNRDGIPDSDDEDYDSEDDCEQEYMVKWKNLYYEDCTWEKASDIKEFQSEIDEFIAREQQQYSTRNMTYRKQRPAFQKLNEQPKWYGKLLIFLYNFY